METVTVNVSVSPDDVLWFWLGDLDGDSLADRAMTQRWWRKDAAFDQEIRAMFEPAWQEIMANEREDWLADAHGRLAYVLVLDQFSRNMFRDTPEAFAGDERALAAASAGIATGRDRDLHGHERFHGTGSRNRVLDFSSLDGSTEVLDLLARVGAHVEIGAHSDRSDQNNSDKTFLHWTCP